MTDASFFVEVIDQNGFSDNEIRVLLIEYHGEIDNLLAPLTADRLAPSSAAALKGAGLSESQIAQPFVAQAVLATTGKAMVKSAEAASANGNLLDLDALVANAVRGDGAPPAAAAASPAPAPAAIVVASSARVPTGEAFPCVEDHPFYAAGLLYVRTAEKYGNRRDSKDVRAISRLFAEFLIEKGVVELSAIRQSHIAEFRALFDELPTHWGKSSADACLADYRGRGAKLPASAGGISGKTWNKHASALNQIIESIRAAGGAIGAPGEMLEPNRLRAKRIGRRRGKRVGFSVDDLKALFRLPCFLGCAGWRRQEPFSPDAHIFHRALYYAPILLYYSGARRDEICGLHCDDVVLDDAIPHVHIRDNAQRRLKNAQSERKIPLHGEILRLGFGQYVREIQRLGYDLLFPDLYSPTTDSPLGDRLYDELAKGLATAVPEQGARKKVLHSLRRTVGAKLKDEGVIPEVRADLLGHGGATVTEEVYANATALERLRGVI